MKLATAFLWLTLSCAALQGRAQAVLRFAPMTAGQPLVLDGEEGSTASPDGTRITLFRFYISQLSLWQDGKSVWSEPHSFHLLDASQPASLSIPLAAAGLRYNAVHFTLGIDSATNAAGAGGGALDATKGMYWAWHSGYINLKLEGTSPRCMTRKNQFQYHLGGFQNGALCAQQLVLPLNNTVPESVDAKDAAQPSEHIIAVDVDTFLAHVDLATRPTLMTPGEEAVKRSAIAAKMFSTATP